MKKKNRRRKKLFVSENYYKTFEHDLKILNAENRVKNSAENMHFFAKTFSKYYSFVIKFNK